MPCSFPQLRAGEGGSAPGGDLDWKRGFRTVGLRVYRVFGPSRVEVGSWDPALGLGLSLPFPVMHGYCFHWSSRVVSAVVVRLDVTGVQQNRGPLLCYLRSSLGPMLSETSNLQCVHETLCGCIGFSPASRLGIVLSFSSCLPRLASSSVPAQIDVQGAPR